MPKMDAYNWLTVIKDTETGGGYMADGKAVRDDAGFLHEINVTLNDLVVPITDSSGGTAGSTIAANAFKTTVIIPIQDTDLVSAQTWKINIPYAFTVTSAGVRTGKPGTGAGASVTLQTQINGVATTGGLITMTLASQATTGTLTAGTAITALNTGTAGQTLEFLVTVGTSFTAGDAYIEFTVTNTDLANMAATLVANTNLVVSETNLKVERAVAGTTQVGTIVLHVPRDYDETTDTMQVQLEAAMSGSTDTNVTLTATAFRKRPGGSSTQVGGTINGVSRANAQAGVTTQVTLTTASQIVVFDFSKQGLLLDDDVTVLITASAHTTDAVLVYGIAPIYRSTLVSFHESTGGTRDGKDGSFLR